jgi:hypothetical protein
MDAFGNSPPAGNADFVVKVRSQWDTSRSDLFGAVTAIQPGMFSVSYIPRYSRDNSWGLIRNILQLCISRNQIQSVFIHEFISGQPFRLAQHTFFLADSGVYQAFNFCFIHVQFFGGDVGRGTFLF